tara:strand:- start:2106 stop:2300 length:195 start_codon:yes stop_codon:yes gene_type:complete
MKTTTTNTLQPSEALFLEWINDFITIKKFAEYHATTEKKMFKTLMLSRDIIIQKEYKQFKTINK